MLGKLVIGAVVCVFVAQVCLAAPQQRQEEQVAASQSESSAETRITQCRSNLRYVVANVANVVYDVASFFTEILAGVSDGFRCLFRPREITRCIPDLFSDTFEGVFEGVKRIVQDILNLGTSLGRAVVSCVLPMTYKSQNLFLVGDNNKHEF